MLPIPSSLIFAGSVKPRVALSRHAALSHEPVHDASLLHAWPCVPCQDWPGLLKRTKADIGGIDNAPPQRHRKGPSVPRPGSSGCSPELACSAWQSRAEIGPSMQCGIMWACSMTAAHTLAYCCFHYFYTFLLSLHSLGLLCHEGCSWVEIAGPPGISQCPAFMQQTAAA